jgi:hypothetical protein
VKHITLASTLSLAILSLVTPALSEESVFRVDPETAKLEIERVEFRQQGEPILVRRFARAEKERGLFGPGWCSNIDKILVGVDSGNPKVLELRECGQKRARTFHKILDAWVEDTSSSRILRKSDGRWELTEAPYPTFRFDGRLDSFQAGQHRWHVRRDSNGRPEALDNLRTRPVKFRRNVSGDLDAILDSKGHRLVRFDLGINLESAEFGGIRESYEYDADGNILRLLRVESRNGAVKSDRPVQVWRFSYTNPEWLASAQDPQGCLSRWIFERSGGVSVARESRTCSQANSGSAPVPVAAAPASAGKQIVNKDASISKAATSRELAALPVAVAPNPVKPDGGKGSTATDIEILKPGPMGIGKERAKVSVNADGLPVAFQVEGPSVRRLEIVREAGSGSALLLRSSGVEVSFRNRPREYSSKQLELLDEYEEWMAAWGNR